MGGSVLRLDIPRDAVSFDCNIKSARGHTSIHMTPWESRCHYKRSNEGSYPPRDKTRQLIENFRAAERRARAILNSRRINLNHTAQIGWMCPGRHNTFPGCPTNTDYQPYYKTRNEAAYRNHQRSALPPPEGKHGEDRMGQENPTARHPMDLQTDEEVLHHSRGRAPTVANLGPHSPDSISSSLISYGMGEDSSPEEDQGQQDQAPEQMDAEEEEDPPMEEATSKLRMGLQVGPAKYQPASPKYVRAEEEEEEEDGDVEAPYLAPRDRARAKDCPEDGPLTSSSESIPAMIDLNKEIPPYQMLTPPRPGNAFHPATLGLDKKATVVLIENLPPPLLSFDKGKPGKRSTPEVTQEGLVAREEVPEESVIYIDDDLEPSPLAKMEAQVDKLKMPPPVDNTLIAAGTLLAISQGPLVYTKADQQPHQFPERRRSGAIGKKLLDRRKARKPLKLDIQAVAKMCTGPRNVHRSQELARLASAVVPLQQLDTAADDTNSNPSRPETPETSETPPKKNQ